MVRKRAQAQKGLSPEKKIRREEELKEKKAANAAKNSIANEEKHVNGQKKDKKVDHKTEKIDSKKRKEESKNQTSKHNTPSLENSTQSDNNKSLPLDDKSHIAEQLNKKTPSEDYNKLEVIMEETINDESDGSSTSSSLQKNIDNLPNYTTLTTELSDKAKSFWATVQHDYTDFTNWTCLLQTVTESEDNIEAARLAYKCFLRYFPLCYGYWKKFADLEKKAGNFDIAEKVFQEGVQAIPISIDLWVHYLNFTVQQSKDKENREQRIRDLFEDAVEYAGMEFKSNKLWDAYIEWEKSQGNLKHVTELYDRLICIPTNNYLKNWQKFKKHLELNPPADTLPTEEYSKIMQEIDAIPPGMSSEDLNPTIITTAPPGEGEGTNVTINQKEDEDLDEDEEKEKNNTEKVRFRVIADREKVFIRTAEKVKKRWVYEDAVKRPYFHIKPLEKSQIKNWKDYLDYEMSEGNHKRICFLFERCVVACALYEEMWEKYLDYIENRNIEVARSVFWRACKIHLLKKFNIHLRWAVFEEKHDNYDLAADVLANIDKNFPGMILITQRRVGLARRMKRYDELVGIYETAVSQADKIELRIFYIIKYSHVLVKFLNDKAKARDVLWGALQLGKKQKRIYLQILDLELHYGEIESIHILKLFDAVENDRNLSEEFQDMFAQRKVEFFEEYGMNIEMILDIKDMYEKQRKKIEPSQPKAVEKKTEKPTSKKFNKSTHKAANKKVSSVQEQTSSANFYPNFGHGDTPWQQAGNYDWSTYAQQYAQQYAYNQS